MITLGPKIDYGVKIVEEIPLQFGYVKQLDQIFIIKGVDLNRNFQSAWGGQGSSSNIWSGKKYLKANY